MYQKGVSHYLYNNYKIQLQLYRLHIASLFCGVVFYLISYFNIYLIWLFIMDQNIDKSRLLKLLQGYAAFTGIELDQMSFLLQKIDEYQIPLEDFLNNCSSY